MDKPNYYAILPASVRYDDRLKANEKILYAEITSLSNKNGYCHATNSYFAELYGVHKITVSNWISNLKESGYIVVKNIYEDNSKEIRERRIYLSETLIPISENINTPINEKANTPISENTKDNNTSSNNTSSNNIYSVFFEEAWKLYPNKKGKGKVSNSKKKEIHKLGDEFKRCIARYISDVERQRNNGFRELKYQNGSTFFNSGYVDYLDENYEGGDYGDFRRDDTENEDPFGIADQINQI